MFAIGRIGQPPLFTLIHPQLPVHSYYGFILKLSAEIAINPISPEMLREFIFKLVELELQ